MIHRAVRWRRAGAVALLLATLWLPRTAAGGVADSPLPSFSDETASVSVLVIPGVVKRGRLQTEVLCTSWAAAPLHIGVEIFDSAGTLLNDVHAGVGAVLNVASGQTVSIGTSATLGFLESTTIPLAEVEQGVARVVASASAVTCSALIVDDAVTPPTALGTLGAGVTLGPGAGLLGAALPQFGNAQTATHSASFPGLIKRGRMETVVFCTSLAATPIDIGVQVFAPNGTLGNDIAAGNGALLAIAPGATVTFGTTGTLAYLESTVVTLAGVAQGVARVVSTSGAVRCAAQVLDAAVTPPVSMSELIGYAPAAAAPPTATATATPLPALVLNPIAAPIVVGAPLSLTGTGFSPGSVLLVYVATASGAQSFGPLTPSARTAITMTVPIPASVGLGNGFATLLLVNTDQGYRQSNTQSQLLYGNPAINLPTITQINGVALRPADPTIPVANVETVVAQGQTVTLTGSGFNSPLVNLFTAGGNMGPLAPLAGGTSTQFQIGVPAGTPTGPGSFQVVNTPYTANVLSNAVSVPIGALLTISGIAQVGTTVTVDGTGFSTLSVINLFAQKAAGGVDNFGGLGVGGTAKIPLTVQSPTRFSFTAPAGAASGPAFVMVLNPPYIPYSSSGSGPSGAFTLSVP